MATEKIKETDDSPIFSSAYQEEPESPKGGISTGIDNTRIKSSKHLSESDSSDEPDLEAQPQKLYDDEGHIPMDRRPSSRRFSSIPTMEEQKVFSSIVAGKFPPKIKEEPEKQVPSIGAGRAFPPPLPNVTSYQVDFDGPDDPLHPFNWSFSRKVLICVALGFTTFTCSWGSAVFSAAVPIVARKYHVRSVVASLSISLYVLGFASGPIIWSPLSELYGRKLPIVVSTFMFTCFVFATATAQDLQTLLICRFFSGMCGSSPLTLVAAAFADMFDNTSRGTAIDIFAMAVFCGPLVAPIAGGFIIDSYLSWRWTLYLTGIMGGASVIACIFLMRETYAPIILVDKAQKIRSLTGNWGVHAAHENVKLDLHEIITNCIARPLSMLFTEPIILLISIYNGFCYLILYLCLSSYPYTFTGKYGWSVSHGMIPYVGILAGMMFCGFVSILYYERDYNKQLKALPEGKRPDPEVRLLPMKPAAIAFPIGLFWFFWSANYHEHCHWIVPCLSGFFTGYGLLGILVPAISYLVDAYLFFAASALASLTFLRSAMGASSPLFATYMFNHIHLNWSGLLLGLVALALAPVPLLFLKYGKKLRGTSKYAFGE